MATAHPTSRLRQTGSQSIQPGEKPADRHETLAEMLVRTLKSMRFPQAQNPGPQQADDRVPALHLGKAEERRHKRASLRAPRYPTTRSRGAGRIALLPKKDMLRAEYLEEMELGANRVTPIPEKHPEFQRKMRMRVKRHKEAWRDKMDIPKEPRGFI
ncbi:MAG: hypothetical protein Q9163_002618 [Psora crenata]